MTEQQQPQQLTRAQRAEQIAYLEALAAAATEAAKAHRDAFKSAAGDEYLKEGSAPTWRVKGIGTISGRVKNDAVAVDDPAIFLAWVKAHRPEDVETIERVKPTVASSLLKGVRPAPDSMALITAGGDEIAGLKYIPGGTFDGIGFVVDKEAKQAYAELARTALDRVQLAVEAEAGTDEQAPAAAAPSAVAAFLATPVTEPADPWAAPADPWATNVEAA